MRRGIWSDGSTADAEKPARKTIYLHACSTADNRDNRAGP